MIRSIPLEYIVHSLAELPGAPSVTRRQVLHVPTGHERGFVLTTTLKTRFADAPSEGIPWDTLQKIFDSFLPNVPRFSSVMQPIAGSTNGKGAIEYVQSLPPDYPATHWGGIKPLNAFFPTPLPLVKILYGATGELLRDLPPGYYRRILVQF